jgi:hypothetical protein
VTARIDIVAGQQLGPVEPAPRASPVIIGA